MFAELRETGEERCGTLMGGTGKLGGGDRRGGVWKVAHFVGEGNCDCEEGQKRMLKEKTAEMNAEIVGFTGEK